jgi:undecaprenyl-diphosphatase
MVLLGPGVGGLLWYFLSRFFDRPRPTTQMDIILSDPSFPSGHALSAVVFYGLLAYLLVPKMPSRFWKWFVVIVLALGTLFIGFSRLLLGGHYATDVVAGYAVGIAWAGLVYTLMERFFSGGRVQEQDRSLNSAPAEGLRTPGLFKRRPVIGLMLFLFGSLSFTALGYIVVTHGTLFQWDEVIYTALITNAKAAPPRIDELMVFGFFVGKQVILVIDAILIIYFLYKRYWPELAMLLISSAGGSFVWNFFVSYFARHRPPEQTGLAVTAVPSFPSGHAMSAVIVYGFLAYLLVPKLPSRLWKWTVGLVALSLVLFDGFSRIFQGSHYLTDVLAGYALGIAWAALVYTLIELIFFRRKV